MEIVSTNDVIVIPRNNDSYFAKIHHFANGFLVAFNRWGHSVAIRKGSYLIELKANFLISGYTYAIPEYKECKNNKYDSVSLVIKTLPSRTNGDIIENTYNRN